MAELSGGEELLSSGEELLSSGEETLYSSVDLSSGVDMLSSGEDDNISLDDGTDVDNSIQDENIYLDDGTQVILDDSDTLDSVMASPSVSSEEQQGAGVEQSGEFTIDDLHNDLLQLTATVADLNDDVKTIGMNNALSDKVIIYVLCMIIGAFIAYCVFSKFSG